MGDFIGQLKELASKPISDVDVLDDIHALLSECSDMARLKASLKHVQRNPSVDDALPPTFKSLTQCMIYDRMGDLFVQWLAEELKFTDPEILSWDDKRITVLLAKYLPTRYAVSRLEYSLKKFRSTTWIRRGFGLKRYKAMLYKAGHYKNDIPALSALAKEAVDDPFITLTSE